MSGWLVSLLYQTWLVVGANIVKPAVEQLPRSTEQCQLNDTVDSPLIYATTEQVSVNTTLESVEAMNL